ncbi:hypothetical protein DM860_011491 [Cuscuta australis]|uniref:Uncharacterized protein n=1 Tax=Cuscuta australis TaxID=267555 RepID=A0A328CZU2_9ASTE|nr:hypothetical protein DM860_011491 [Cuscuta australis]
MIKGKTWKLILDPKCLIELKSILLRLESRREGKRGLRVVWRRVKKNKSTLDVVVHATK